jgi:hypothetical protein
MSGHRDVHGIRQEETAIGYQLVCKACKKQHSAVDKSKQGHSTSYCFATTNASFWGKWEHWEIPRKTWLFISCRLLLMVFRRHSVFPEAVRHNAGAF